VFVVVFNNLKIGDVKSEAIKVPLFGFCANKLGGNVGNKSFETENVVC